MDNDNLPEPPEIGACDWYDMVREFHQAFNHPAPDNINEMHLDRRKYRAIWMAEEIVEFVGAEELVDQVDSMLDLIVFALGTLVEMGVDPRELFDEVHYANIQKLWPDGKPRYREDNKLMKPASWEPPQYMMHKILNQRLKAEEQAHLDKIKAGLEEDDIPF
jgi:predicted HAD superfamily Cof-like phosphohydrolase